VRAPVKAAFSFKKERKKENYGKGAQPIAAQTILKKLLKRRFPLIKIIRETFL
jgi:hypothetical protein